MYIYIYIYIHVCISVYKYIIYIYNCNTNTAVTDSVCTSNPCENSGTCVLQDVYYKCICPPSYTGKRCESMNICIHYYYSTFVLARL